MFKKLLLTVSLCLAPACALAQQSPAPDQMATVPVTKVLAVGKLTAPPTRELQSGPIMQQEVRDTVKLYLAGNIDQWFVRKDLNGVVFILNASTVEQAQELLSALPLVKSQRMTFDLIPLGPLSPLSVLLREAPGSQQQPKP